MIAFVGAGSTDPRDIFAAFREGSKSDPYVSAGLGQEYTCYPHGWGLALYDGIDFHHVRSSLPVWETKTALPPMKGKVVHAIFHSRLASNPALNSPLSSHPFIAYTNDDVLLLAHNGGVEVEDPSATRITLTATRFGPLASPTSCSLRCQEKRLRKPIERPITKSC